MPARVSFKTIAEGLSVSERVLLFCLATYTDWQKAGVTHATAQQMMIKGLVERQGGGPSFRRIKGARCSRPCSGSADSDCAKRLLLVVDRKYYAQSEAYRFCRVGPGNFTPSRSQIRT
jgi:hypothetical protein